MAVINLFNKIFNELKNINTIERALTGLLMDLVYYGSSYLIFMGVTLIPVRVNASVFVVNMFIFCYLYRYVNIWDLGEGARPLLTQAGIKMPPLHFIKIIFNGVFIVLIMPFPSLLVLAGMFVATGGAPETHTLTAYIPITAAYLAALFFLMYSFFVFIENRESNERYGEGAFYPEPGNIVKIILTKFFIPLLAIVTSCSLSILTRFIFENWNTVTNLLFSGRPGTLDHLLFTVTLYVPFRYLVMRTVGVSLISLLSFIVSTALVLLGYLAEMF